MQVKPGCTFCGIIAGEIPSTTIAETDRAIAFMDINPVTEGHALVVPREHASDLLDVAHDDLAACALLSQEIARRAKDRLGADGVNLLNCSGADAWQTEFHFHVHVIPRFKNQPARDRSIRLPWDPAPGDLDEIVRIGTRLSWPDAWSPSRRSVALFGPTVARDYGALGKGRSRVVAP